MEIKFKAWHKAHKRFYKVIALYQMMSGKVTKLMLEGLQNLIPIGAVELLQYTNLKDKNGVEIYLGDIVKYLDYDYQGEDEHHNIGCVDFDEEVGCYYFTNRFSVEMDEVDYSEVEIIGSVHSNPELLGGNS